MTWNYPGWSAGLALRSPASATTTDGAVFTSVASPSSWVQSQRQGWVSLQEQGSALIPASTLNTAAKGAEMSAAASPSGRMEKSFLMQFRSFVCDTFGREVSRRGSPLRVFCLLRFSRGGSCKGRCHYTDRTAPISWSPFVRTAASNDTQPVSFTWEGGFKSFYYQLVFSPDNK